MASGLKASEILAHPGFKHQKWDLPPSDEGYADVAAKRNGGPFKLWYQVHGNGPTRVVWIMGLGAFHTAWKRQTRYFGHQHTEYSSLVFDNRGVGKSDKPTSRYSTTEMAKDVINLLMHVGWLNADYSLPATTSTSSTSPSGPGSNSNSNKLNIIGVSMGGMIAQELSLLLPPSTINALLLVSTAPRLVRTVPFIENLRQRINMFIPRDLDVQLDEVCARLFSADFLALPDTEADEPFGPGGGPRANFPTNRDRYCAVELDKRMDKDGFTRKGFVLQAIAAGWHSKDAKQVRELGERVGKGRVGVAHGTLDRMITFHHGELLRDELGLVALQTELGAELCKVWEGKGHVLLWEEESEFNQWVAAFIKRCAEMS